MRDITDYTEQGRNIEVFQSARTSEMLLGDTLLPTVIREFQFTRGREMQLNPIVEGMWIGVSIHSHVRNVTVITSHSSELLVFQFTRTREM